MRVFRQCNQKPKVYLKYYRNVLVRATPKNLQQVLDGLGVFVYGITFIM